MKPALKHRRATPDPENALNSEISVAGRDALSASDDSVSQVQKNCMKRMETFEPHQTRILQKWFLDNIEHPYLKTEDKALIAIKTGLEVRQIQGWLTNNRKRKYQKVLQAAKRKHKDMSKYTINC